MLDLSGSFRKLIYLTFVVSLFLSTGAVVDFLISGASVREQLEEGNSQLRMILWLPVYLSCAVITVVYFRKIRHFFEQNLAFLTLLGLAVISFSWSALPSLSLYSSLQLVLLSCFAIVVGYTYSIEFILKQIFYVFRLIIILSFLFVILLPEYGISVYVGENAFRGVFPEKNRLGQILVYFFCLNFAFFEKKATSILSLIIATILLLGNGSATALVLILLLPLLVRFSPVFYGDRDKIMVNSFFVVMIILMVTVFIMFTYEYFLMLLGKDPTLTGRTELWALGLDSVMQKPLLGFGYNSFWKYDGGMGGEYIRYILTWGPMSMHNGWFETLLQLGMVGFGIALFVYFKLVRLVVTAMNYSGLEKTSKCLFLFVTVYFVWTLMQHIILRHQEFSHFLFVILLSSLTAYKYAVENESSSTSFNSQLSVDS
ncbi:MAG: O-antigen ligase [Aliiglaciecola sp.]